MYIQFRFATDLPECNNCLGRRVSEQKSLRLA